MTHRAAMIGRANLAIQVIGLVVVLVVGLVILSAAFTAADKQAARQQTEFDFLTRVSQAQTCALVGVISRPPDERDSEAVQLIVNDCYMRAGVIAEAPTVDELVDG